MNEEEKNTQIKNNNKTKKVIVIFCIALIFVLLGIVTYYNYTTHFVYANQNTNTEDKKEDPKREEQDLNKEKELEDTALKITLVQKVMMLLNEEYNSKMSNSYNMNNFNEILFKNLKLTDMEKLILILDYVDKTNANYMNIDKEKITNENILKNYDQYKKTFDSKEKFAILNIENVEEEYNKLFNALPKHQDTLNQNHCPIYFYDETNKVYYKTNECDKVSNDMAYTYINKITSKDNVVYVYVNYGSAKLTSEDLNNEENNRYTIYGDASEEKIITSNVSKDLVKSYQIDTGNYKNFTEYKFTFMKDSNNNYYFYSIEKN